MLRPPTLFKRDTCTLLVTKMGQPAYFAWAGAALASWPLGDAIRGAFLTGVAVVSNRKGPPHDPPSGGPFVSSGT
jgi:hypothetical protein